MMHDGLNNIEALQLSCLRQQYMANTGSGPDTRLLLRFVGDRGPWAGMRNDIEAGRLPHVAERIGRNSK